MRRFLVLGMVLLGLVLMIDSPAQAASPRMQFSRMQFSEIWYNSPGKDTGTNSSLDQEWVQLHNRSGSRISLTGWTLRDAQNHVYTFGTYTIKPHGYVKIHTGKGGNTQTDLYWGHSWYIWNNTGDRATLKDAHGKVLGQCSYTGSSAGHTSC